MNWPPMVMRIKISQPERRLNLWLPLFIMFPIAFIITVALFLLLLPLILIAAAVFWRLGFWRPLFFFWPAVLGCLSAMRGLEVDVDQNQERIFISFK